MFREKIKAFLDDLHQLEKKHDVSIGEVFHTDEGPDEIELWSGRDEDPFHIARDYGHYAIIKRTEETP